MSLTKKTALSNVTLMLMSTLIISSWDCCDYCPLQLYTLEYYLGRYFMFK